MLTISFGKEHLTAISTAMADVIAFYQVGCCIAFGVEPPQDAGISRPPISGFTAIIAVVMAMLSFFVAPRQPAVLLGPATPAGSGLAWPPRRTRQPGGIKPGIHE